MSKPMRFSASIVVVLAISAVSFPKALLAQFNTCTVSNITLGNPYNLTKMGPASDGTYTYQYNFDLGVTCSSGYTSQCNVCIRTAILDDHGNFLSASYTMLPGYAACGQSSNFTFTSTFRGLTAGNTYVLGSRSPVSLW
jgi:hypothetical protein